MSRISGCLGKLKSEGRKALIPYFMAGDPEPGITVPLMHAVVKAGADIIELGVPFSDPMAEIGEVPRAIVAWARDYSNGHVLPFHRHSRSQLLYASAGVMTVTTMQGIWVVQLIDYLTLGFTSGRDLGLMRLSPTLGSLQSASLPFSLCPSPQHTLFLS